MPIIAPLPPFVTFTQLVARFVETYREYPAGYVTLSVSLAAEKLPGTRFNRSLGVIDRTGQQIIAEQMIGLFAESVR